MIRLLSIFLTSVACSCNFSHDIATERSSCTNEFDDDTPALLLMQTQTELIKAPLVEEGPLEKTGNMLAEELIPLYLDTVRDSLTGALLRTPGVTPGTGKGTNLARIPFDTTRREAGSEWCDSCFTMAGGARLDNVRSLVEDTISRKVQGDFVETGTWRGGSSIMARAVQRVRGEGLNRRVYACDSFDGLPKASQSKDNLQDSQVGWNAMDFLKVTKEEVESNFKSFHMLDGNVRFVKGYFMNSLPLLRQQLQKEGRSLAVLRGDGDMYESYMDILYNLYEFIPIGGYFICDDCHSIASADQAIQEFRNRHGITDEMEILKSAMGTFWQKSSMVPVRYDLYLQWNATRHPMSL